MKDRKDIFLLGGENIQEIFYKQVQGLVNELNKKVLKKNDFYELVRDIKGENNYIDLSIITDKHTRERQKIHKKIISCEGYKKLEHGKKKCIELGGKVEYWEQEQKRLYNNILVMETHNKTEHDYNLKNFFNDCKKKDRNRTLSITVKWLQKYRTEKRLFKQIWEIITLDLNIITIRIKELFLISLKWLNDNELYKEFQKEIIYIKYNWVELKRNGIIKVLRKEKINIKGLYA